MRRVVVFMASWGNPGRVAQVTAYDPWYSDVDAVVEV